MKTAIVGINWGDEGKGRMVDLLAEKYDVVVRYQGGNNAGHTVYNPQGKFVLNLLPSGILRPEVVNVMGSGMVIDLKHLVEEMKRLTEKGVKITPDNLKISDKATICMPYHVTQDGLEEDRLAGKKFGSTRRGIAPSYSDKFMKKTLRLGDLVDGVDYTQRIRDTAEWKNLLFSSYGQSVNADEILAWLETYGKLVAPFVTNTGKFLMQADKSGKNIMFEAQLGALRDIDFGIFPYTSSSNTLAAYAPIGSGAPALNLDGVVGIVKAYSSCVGEGPFVAELFGAEGDVLREAGGEYGAATGRPRRVGALDVPATNYGIALQGATELAVTKIDVLSCYDKIPVCTAYSLNGKVLEDFPYPALLDDCKPVIEYLDGWKEDISGARCFGDLPKNAQKYIEYMQAALGCKIKYVSVGAEREQYFVM